ncbi:replication initiator protein [Microviridae sp.]|nr:replication initiator protein [Microviridae sp.]
MLCKKPYMKTANTSRLQTVLSVNARTAATPFGCGQCFHCRINKKREWSTRILLESMTHNQSVFLTLTYNDEHLPKCGNLQPNELKNYLKKIRKSLAPRTLRYFAVGEYGDQNWRPHYHLILFNVGYQDQEALKAGWSLHKQEKGFIQLGDVNKKTAHYIAGYCFKKLTGKNDPKLHGREPEFMRCSTKNGGIGYPAIKIIAQQLKKHADTDKRVTREIRVGGQKLPLGRYLTEKLSQELEISDRIKEKELYDYQEDLFNTYMDSSTTYYTNILDLNAPKRLSKEKRTEIFKTGRYL